MKAHLTIIWASAVLLSAVPTAADPWTAVGAPSRPPWVSGKAERRLNMLAALPAIASTLKGEANGYFGTKGPGMSIGLVLDDGLYYSQGFGFSDASKTKAPDEFTVFRAGSLSKVMTGTALLTLIDDPARHMSLSDAADLPEYLPELKFVCPKWQQRCVRGHQNNGIRLSNLVSHTAGLANVFDQNNAGISTWLSDLKKSWLLFAPGSFSAYSGDSIEGVGLIEKRVSGLAYPAFVKKNLFDPLGMTHSTMDPIPPEPLAAQKWQWAATDTTWSFTRFNGIIGGDDQPMILPAGGLATNVIDLSRFIRMWLSGTAPQVGNHPMLKPATIASARQSQFASIAAPPAYCGNKNVANTDANSFSYSTCATAFGFGVSWYVGLSPYLQHNGDEPGLSGSNTLVNQAGRIGATGLVSTEAYPQRVNPPPAPPPPQPAGLDGNFMGTVVSELIKAGTAADATTDWTGKALATGVARVLWLSGKPLQSSDLNAFTPAFRAAHHLTATSVVPFLQAWRLRYGECSSFRVRGVTSLNTLVMSLNCGAKDFATVLQVELETPHRIAWTDPPATPPKSSSLCVAGCDLARDRCIAGAHSGPERGACVVERNICLKGCSSSF